MPKGVVSEYHLCATFQELALASLNYKCSFKVLHAGDCNDRRD